MDKRISTSQDSSSIGHNIPDKTWTFVCLAVFFFYLCINAQVVILCNWITVKTKLKISRWWWTSLPHTAMTKQSLRSRVTCKIRRSTMSQCDNMCVCCPWQSSDNRKRKQRPVCFGWADQMQIVQYIHTVTWSTDQRSEVGVTSSLKNKWLSWYTIHWVLPSAFIGAMFPVVLFIFCFKCFSRHFLLS